MNPQTKAEAERILSVLDELLEDLDILMYLPPYYSNLTKDELSGLGPAAANQLAQFYDIERKVELDAEGDVGTHHRVVVSVLGHLRKQLFVNNTSLPAADPLARFKRVIVILRGLMYNNFSTTVEEDDQKLQILKDTVSREQHASADVKALNREFITEQKLRQTEVSKKDQAIHKLMEEVQEVERKAHEDIMDYDRVATERKLLEEQQAAQEEAELEAKVEELENQLAKLREMNQKDEGLLRADRKKKENNLSTIINDYDKEMTQKAAEREKLSADYDEDNIQLAKVEEELKAYTEENNNWDEEDKIKQERRRHNGAIKSRLETSARQVQAFWRGYAERNNLKKRSKKGKGKGGGKDKKKK
eukprot:TRINITY_DN3142_c0_g5_i1.p2 TRINITY_DN3142_c0_g5~~TRINITY_DN3142_c0_g5_i1.p2  ORF type:complete len:361 (+),score=211.30 TRINITY_DN3142_c0_g5_i1:116-1198(+)